MRIFVWLALFLACASVISAAGNGMEQGRALFRSNCAFCHGLTGQGGRGPSLVSGLQKTDQQIKEVIRDGVPGSTMPAFSGFEPDDLNALVTFIHNLNGGSAPEPVNGDPAKGRMVYQQNGCAGCHQIAGEGSTFGPDLTRVGGARSLHYLRESVVDPSADIPESYQGVTVVTRDGKRISGIRVNEDTFSVQLRLMSQQFRSFIKDDVRQVTEDTKSLMPAYTRLSSTDLDNLLAYLVSLRGETEKGAKAKKAGGIR